MLLLMICTNLIPIDTWVREAKGKAFALRQIANLCFLLEDNNQWQFLPLKTPLSWITTMSELQQLLMRCVSSTAQLATNLMNGLLHYAKQLFSWIQENKSLLMKMASAAILITSTLSGKSLIWVMNHDWFLNWIQALVLCTTWSQGSRLS